MSFKHNQVRYLMLEMCSLDMKIVSVCKFWALITMVLNNDVCLSNKVGRILFTPKKNKKKRPCIISHVNRTPLDSFVTFEW